MFLFSEQSTDDIVLIHSFVQNQLCTDKKLVQRHKIPTWNDHKEKITENCYKEKKWTY